MPHRKLVNIGQKPPALPTVRDYFQDLARLQGEDIRLLKERAQALADQRAAAARGKSAREESWRLHPVVPSETRKKATSKKSAKKSSRRKR